ncbi:MAG TPA: hypothetical protein VJ036_07975 [bacterium]|nr:hypothetical protein [bacterium]
MGQKDGHINTTVNGGRCLRLQQTLVDIIDVVNDQLTQIEQKISQSIPDLAVGLSSAGQMRKLQSTLEQLLSMSIEEETAVISDSLNQALARSWQEERAWAQARERALEQATTNLLQAAWLGTALKRQSLLTEGLAGAKGLMGNKGGGGDEEHN